jgi:hypothetical protein
LNDDVHSGGVRCDTSSAASGVDPRSAPTFSASVTDPGADYVQPCVTPSMPGTLSLGAVPDGDSPAPVPAGVVAPGSSMASASNQRLFIGACWCSCVGRF